MTRNSWLLVVAALIALRLAAAVAIARGEAATSVDFDRFWTIASSSATPYVAYRVEYTPFAVAVFKAVSTVARDRASFGMAMTALACAADLVAAAALGSSFGWEAAAVYLLVTLPLLDLFYNRFDFIPTAAAAVGIAALRRRRVVLAACALICGAAFKVWPLVLTPLLIGDTRLASNRRSALLLIAGIAVLSFLWLGIAGMKGTVQIVTFRGASGWQIETLVGNVIALRSPGTVRYELNAFRVGAISSEAIVMWLTLGIEAAIVLAWLGAQTRRVGLTWLASVGALLLLSPLFSPQFMAWLAPGAALAWVEKDRPAALSAVLALLLTALFLPHYDDLVSGSRWQLVVTARNLVLCAMVIAAAIPLVRNAINGRRTGGVSPTAS